MPYQDYPSDKELAGVLKDSGFISTPSQSILQAAISAAANQFERRTGWIPFLGQMQVRSFNPPGFNSGATSYLNGGGRKLNLDSGLISLGELRVDQKLLTLGTDFYLKPANQRPFEWIEFAVPQFGKTYSITVSGLWGYSLTLPDDAWLAIIRLAQIDISSQYLQGTIGGISKWSEGLVSEEYGSKPLEGILENYQTYSDKIIDTYRRIGVG